MAGNFIADAIKGKKYLEYEAEISRGILMHREIDTFTDSHGIVSHSKSFFRARYGLYSPVIVDLVYDHFLAKNFSVYSDEPLPSFADRCYQILEKYLSVMPDQNLYMFPYMKRENWLLRYAKIEGIRQSLTGMSRRIKNHSDLEHAHEELALHYDELELDFLSFFSLLKTSIQERYK
jgi:acyl carrier protein phosphodiesterase